MIRTGLLVALCLPLLAACGGQTRGNDPTEYSSDYHQDPGSALQKDAAGSLTGGGSLFSFGVNKPKDDNGGGGGLGVNAYLWRGSLDTLSFMPLASADPFGGVIVTDWYSPPGVTDERFKATAYILGRQLRSDAVRISIYRQVLQNGQWIGASVSPVTIGQIEDKVLARARQLRMQSQAGS